jgi:hypothetical protein
MYSSVPTELTAVLRRRLAAAAAALVFCLGLPAPAALGSHPPAGSTWSEAYFPSRDGTSLHADVFRPDGLPQSARTPAMLVVSPYLGLPAAADPEQPRVLDRYRRLYEGAISRGYTVVQVNLRGTGASGGCTDFGGPGDRGDVAAAIGWTATQPWSTGRVGMAGHSYDGFAAVAGMAERPDALAAAVVMAPAVDLYRGVYMNGVPYLQSPVVGSYYQGLGLIPPLGDLSQVVNGTGGRDPSCASEVAGESRNPDASSAYWRERDLTPRVAGSRVPVLWTHGFLDGRDDYSSVRPDNFLSVWTRLAGPRRAWFGQFPHVVPGELNTWNEPEPLGRDGFVGEALDWLDAYVRRDAAATARVTRAPAVAVQEGARGDWLSEAKWPPPPIGTAELELAPGSYADAPGNKAEQGEEPGGGCATGVHARCNPMSRTGQGSWTFSPPLSADVRIAGVARLRARLDGPPAARLIALVYDVDRADRASLLTRGATLIGSDGSVEFGLYPQDWVLRAGHRVGVLLSGSDDFYFEPGTTEATVAVTGGALTVPLAPAPGPKLAGGASRAVAERTSFPVEPATVAERTRALELPPAARERIVLRVRPSRVKARRAVRLRISVATRSGRGVRGARVRVGRRLVRTGAGGQVRITARFYRPGRRVLRASAPRVGRASTWVRVVR